MVTLALPAPAVSAATTSSGGGLSKKGLAEGSVGLLGAIIIGIVGGLSEREIVDEFMAGAGDMMSVVLIIAVSRGVSVLMSSTGLSNYFLTWAAGALAGTSGILFSIGSYVTIRAFEPHSLYTMRLAQKGELLTHHKDKAVLTLMNVGSVIETDFIAVRPDMSLGDVVKEAIAKSSRSMFPVVNTEGVLLGIVLVDNIRNIMFRPELYERFRVSRFMVSPPARIVNDMPMEKIMHIFDDTKAWNLPVVDTEGTYIGFVSKSKIFNAYREVLVDTFTGD